MTQEGKITTSRTPLDTWMTGCLSADSSVANYSSKSPDSRSAQGFNTTFGVATLQSGQVTGGETNNCKKGNDDMGRQATLPPGRLGWTVRCIATQVLRVSGGELLRRSCNDISKAVTNQVGPAVYIATIIGSIKPNCVS